MEFKARNRTLQLSKPVLMGILNVTPDSFSDGGRYSGTDAAVQRGVEMVRQGAKIIDVGGESTRPGSNPVSAAEEKRRVIPVIKALAIALRTQKSDVLISVDTCKPDVAAAALAAGAVIVNDVTGFTDDAMRAVVGKRHAGAIVMHMQGTPRTMQQNPVYSDVVADVKAFLSGQAAAVMDAGASGVMVDPGIGFGKTFEHNISILNRLDEFAALGYPLCVGVSRKRFIGTLTDEPDAVNRLEGTLAAVTACVLRGADVLRVHDVSECRKALEVAYAMKPPKADRVVPMPTNQDPGRFSARGGNPEERETEGGMLPPAVPDEIRVQGIVITARTGILPLEKKTAQPLLVNVVAYLDLKAASVSNDVKDTLDYRRIVTVVETTAASRHWPLLESLAEQLAGKIKSLGALRVVVQVTKPESLKNGVPTVIIER